MVPECEHCGNYVAPGQHRWKWWEVVPAIVLAGGMIGGWVWSAATQTSQAAEFDKRITAVEKFKDASVDKITEILTRVVRIETMVEKK